MEVATATEEGPKNVSVEEDTMEPDALTSVLSQQSQSPPSSCSSNIRSVNPRHHSAILQSIRKQKIRKEKIEAVQQARQAVARSHLDKGIENLNFTLPEEMECRFDAENTGLGSHILMEDYRAALEKRAAAKQFVLKDPQSGGRRPSHLPRSSAGSRSSKESLEGPRSKTSSTAQNVSMDSSMYSGSIVSGKEDSPNAPKKCDVVRQKVKDLLRFKAPEHVIHRYAPKEEGIPWFNDRVNLSSVAVRYELPMDFRRLQGMDIKTYLSKYCKISEERMIVYRRVYKRHKSAKAHVVLTADLPRAIHDIIYDCVPEEAVKKFLRSLGIHLDKTEVDLKTFAVLAATAERILYLSFAETAGPVSPGLIQSFTECADFGALKWKLRNIELDPGLNTLLFSLGYN